MGTHPIFEADFDCLTEIMRRVSKLGTRLSHVRKASASSGIDTPKLFTEERGEGIVERGLNALGRKWYQKGAFFNFAQHAEHKSTWNLDHISSGNEASCTVNHQTLLHDKYCKWFTVEGMPGAGKGKFTADVAEGAGLKNMGTGHLWWEHERLREFKDQPGLYTLWAELIQSHNHYLAMRDVYMDKFFENPTDIVHSCRLQDHMKLQRHIHSMDALFHLLTTATGTITNRTYHSDYCFAYAMYKMGYMSKNYYEMRYTVSHATMDGSGTACDLTPNVSFLLDISPEESFESIKARGNEAEIATVNLEFLKHLHEAYHGMWSEDMNTKGCTVFKIDPNSQSAADTVDMIDELGEDDLRHPYSRWSHIHEKQFANNTMHGFFGKDHGWTEAIPGWNRPDVAMSGRANMMKCNPFRLLFQGGNHYEHVLTRDLLRGAQFSYDMNYSFHPWDDLAESYSMKENLEFVANLEETELMDEMGRKSREAMRWECKPMFYHPDWLPESADWFNCGKTTSNMRIAFGSIDKYYGNEFMVKKRQLTL